MGVCKRNVVLQNNVYDAQLLRERRLDIDNIIHSELFYQSHKTVVMGGHYFIYPENPQFVGENPKATWDLACKTVSQLRAGGMEAYVSILMNDPHLTEEQVKKVRRDYQIPKELEDILKGYRLCDEDIIRCGGSKASPAYGKIYWERHLINRFDNPPGFRKRYGKSIREPLTGECSKAIAEYIKDLFEQRVDNLVMIFPGCSYDNVVRGVNHAKKAFSEMKIYCIWYTGNCTR